MAKNPFAVPSFGQTTSLFSSGTASSSPPSTGVSLFAKQAPPAQGAVTTASATGSGGGFGGQKSLFGTQPQRVFGQTTTAGSASSFPVRQSSSAPKFASTKTEDSSLSTNPFGKKESVPDNPFKLKAVGTPPKNLFGTSPGQPASGRDPTKSLSDSAVSGQPVGAQKQTFQFSTGESLRSTWKAGDASRSEAPTVSSLPKAAQVFGGRNVLGGVSEEGESKGKPPFSTTSAGNSPVKKKSWFGSSSSHQASRSLADQGGSKVEGQTSGVKHQSMWTDAESGEKGFRNVTEDSAAPLSSRRGAIDGAGDPGNTRLQAMQDARAAPLPDDDDDNDEDNESISSQSTEKSGSHQVRRMSSVTDDWADRVCIECKGIPAKYNQGSFLRKHFKQFGKVVRVFPIPQKSSAVIRFADHESAQRAKRDGRSLAPGISNLQIFWRNPHITRRPALSTSSPGTSRPSSQEEPAQPESQRMPRKRKPGLFGSSEVENELASMAGCSEGQGSSRARTRRPSPAARMNFSDLAKQAQSSRTASSSQQLSTSSGQGLSSKASGARQPSPPPERSASRARRSEAGAQPTASTVTPSVGKTAGERFQILDARDKMFRQSRKKQDNYATARAFVGTCPDMCPEKERYDREDKRRLHAYEIVPGTDQHGQNPVCDHSRAVKEYSRSSADQEEPLPQELRPLPVLETTMMYMLSEIADRGGEGKWADWYTFFWDRTRGIRKDITQQQLSSQKAAELLEKCSRFHIYCAERLCEEDMSSFDAKINNENLTKCLQTLKEFYDDLTKGGVFCCNEAEFRAYVVLMNINEGDTLREVQQLRSEVLNSPAISFAVKVYLAVNNNNYMRFFRLVAKASFLQACIMHRYFTQVRSKALLTIIKAYRSKFPLADLVRVLAFEGEAEATDFCQYFGLPCEEGYLKLDHNYIEPETAVPPRRAITLIESKQEGSVGKGINGETLPEFTLPKPTFSFDDQGKLINSAKIQVIESQGDSFQQQQQQMSRPSPPRQPARPPAPGQEVQAAPQAVPSATRITGESIKLVTKELFLEVIDDLAKEVSDECYQDVQEALAVTLQLQYSILNDDASAMLRELVEEAVEEERRRMEVVAREEHRVRVERATQAVAQDLLEEASKEQLRDLITDQMRKEEAEQLRQRFERTTAAVGEELVDGGVTALVWELAAEVFEQDVVQRRQALAAALSVVELRRTARFLVAWRKQLAARQRRRRAMATFPCAPPCMSLEDQLKALLPDREEDSMQGRQLPLTRTARLTVEVPMAVEQLDLKLKAQLSMLALKRHLEEARAWQPLPLPRLVGPSLCHLLHRMGEQADNGVCLLWKLVVSLPRAEAEEEEEEGRGCPASRTLQTWLKAQLSRGNPSTPPQLSGKSELWSLYSAEVTARVPVRLGVCVRGVCGILGDAEVEEAESRRTLLGTTGLMILLDPLPDAEAEEEEKETYWLETTLRLARLLQAKPMQPPLPLVVVIPHPPGLPPTEEEVGARLELKRYVNQGLVTRFGLLNLPLDPSYAQGVNVAAPAFSELLPMALSWLATYIEPQPRLEVKELRMLVEDTLQVEVSSPILHNLRLRKKKGLLHQPLWAMLELYNAVVQHLASVVANRDLARLSWPIPEFTRSHSLTEVPPPHWNTAEQLQRLQATVLGLGLPEWQGSREPENSWHQVCQDLSHYVAAVMGGTTGSASVSLMSRLETLLWRVEEAFKRVCWLMEGETGCHPTAAHMPWTEVLEALISFRLETLCCTDLTAAQTGQEERELVVAYDQTELNRFQPPASWSRFSFIPDPPASGGVTLKETVARAVEHHREEAAAAAVARSPPVSPPPAPTASDQSSAAPQARPAGDWLEGDGEPSNVAETRAGIEQLASRVQRAKEESRRMLEYLQAEVSGTRPPGAQQTRGSGVASIGLGPRPDLCSGADEEDEFSPSRAKYPCYGYSIDSKMEAVQSRIRTNKIANDIHTKKLEFLLGRHEKNLMSPS